MKDGAIVLKTSADVIDKGTGTVYMTIGATTPDHSELGKSTVEPMYKMVYGADDQPAYTIVSVKGNLLTFTTRQADGLVIDSFKIRGEGVSDEELNDAFETEVVPDTTANDGTQTEDKGCGSAVSAAGLAVVATLASGIVFIAKKKEN